MTLNEIVLLAHRIGFDATLSPEGAVGVESVDVTLDNDKNAVVIDQFGAEHGPFAALEALERRLTQLLRPQQHDSRLT